MRRSVIAILLAFGTEAGGLRVAPVRPVRCAMSIVMQAPKAETLTLTIKNCGGGIGVGLDEDNLVDRKRTLSQTPRQPNYRRRVAPIVQLSSLDHPQRRCSRWVIKLRIGTES